MGAEQPFKRLGQGVAQFTLEAIEVSGRVRMYAGELFRMRGDEQLEFGKRHATAPAS